VKFRRISGCVQASLLAALVTKRLSYADMVDLTGVSQPSLSIWTNALRAEKLIYVSAWGDDVRGYPTVPHFSWGPGYPDALRPYTPVAERMRNLRMRKKGSTHEIERN
jgi:hypothetical protein